MNTFTEVTADYAAPVRVGRLCSPLPFVLVQDTPGGLRWGWAWRRRSAFRRALVWALEASDAAEEELVAIMTEGDAFEEAEDE